MHIENASDALRTLQTRTLSADLAVCGGGLSGVCAAVQAAREGLQVILVQDRPVLGGNASSEVRLWALGATSHMGNNNRWAREGGIIDELVVENLYRNPEGNPLLFDLVLIDKVQAEAKITLLLDTAVFAVEKTPEGGIAMMRGFSSQNSTLYEIHAPLFCDASGDGILGYLSGASYRIGAEDADEFDEGLAPDEDYGELLGHTIYFYTKDTGAPVDYVAPDFALRDLSKIPRLNEIGAKDYGCLLWWFEYGGRLDTIHDSASIKLELWKVVYGVWDHIKNSGAFPDAQNLTLEWVGHIPGKRESRRFIGDTMITQKDVMEQRHFEDAVSFGGWAVDLHPADGVYSDKRPCNQYHSKGVYQIPYRALYSRDIPNLFLAGRLISASHIAFGSTRVMMTGAHNAQAVGTAAALCHEQKICPRELLRHIDVLRSRLQRSGQFIPHHHLPDAQDLCRSGTFTASSTFAIRSFPENGEWQKLDSSRAMLLPMKAGALPEMTLKLSSETKTVLKVELRISERQGNFTPDVTLESLEIYLERGGGQSVHLKFDTPLEEDQYVFLCLMKNEAVSVPLSDLRSTGILSLANGMNKAVAKGTRQEAEAGSGIDSFEFWIPARRPGGKNLALSFEPPLEPYATAYLNNGYERPFLRSNAWAADPEDPGAMLTCRWDQPVRIRRILLAFDGDHDHPMESAQLGHPERVVPYTLKHYRIRGDQNRIVFETEENRLPRADIQLEALLETSSLSIELLESRGTPAALTAFRCYS